MRVSRFAWAIALALVLVVSLLVSVPARLLSLVLPAEQVMMQGFSGTLWSGSASRCMLRLPAGYLSLGKVQWSLRPLSLLLLAPRLTLNSRWGEQVVSGGLVLRGSGDLDVVDLQATVSMDLVRHFSPLALDGGLSLQVAHLQLRDGLPHSGEGRVVWTGGSWLSPRGSVALGSYAVDFAQQAGEALYGEVLTLAGPMEALGQVKLEGRRYAADVLVKGENGVDPQLQQALSLIATPESGGYRITLDGDF